MQAEGTDKSFSLGLVVSTGLPGLLLRPWCMKKVAGEQIIGRLEVGVVKYTQCAGDGGSGKGDSGKVCGRGDGSCSEV